MLTPSEVRDAVAHAEERFVQTCTSATTAEWQFQPPGSGDRAWSMPQVVEHVTSANQTLLPVLRDILITSPRGEQPLDFEDHDMPYLFYGGVGDPPAGLLDAPSGTPADKSESLAALHDSVRALLDWYDTVAVDLRRCALTHPAFGLFDGAQWLLFAAVHMRQHRGQLLDLMLARSSSAGAEPTSTP